MRSEPEMSVPWAAGTIRKNRVLTTHGPYAFTRNPLYFGSFIIGIGFGVLAFFVTLAMRVYQTLGIDDTDGMKATDS